MLFHVTMTHTEDNCPAYDSQALESMIATTEANLERAAKEANAKVHFLLWGAPEHVAYALVEADSYGAVARTLFGIPIKQDFKVTPVQHLHDVIEMGRAMMAAQR